MPTVNIGGIQSGRRLESWSVLSPLLHIALVEVISKKKRTRYFLRKSLYVDNTAVVADNGAEWKEIFGGLGLRVSLENTVYGGALGRAAGKKTSRNKI